jgi:FkbM family methyltransferase
MQISTFKVIVGSLLVALTRGIIKKYKCYLLAEDLLLNLDHSTIPDSIRAAMVLGLLERAERKLVRRYLPAGLSCIEIGSSFGNLTLEIIRAIGKKTPILSIEANPLLSAWLKEQVANSNRLNHRVINAAATQYDTENVLFCIDAGGLGSRISRDHSPEDVSVQGFSLGKIIEIAGFQRFSLVCDIEGAEFDFFCNSRNLLSKCDALVIELHPVSGPKAQAVIAEFELAGLELIEKRREVCAFIRRA